ncbi:uncharacterized protein LOC143296998 [Babylonia areolata]|uniref:uncharacterized protein LOC143296998 n=1 Tax=Babylonia areolata TaxID=304850 RepID=UPI003FD6BE5D
MALKTSSGACTRLSKCSNSLCCESAVVVLTFVSVLAICGEMLVDFGILTVPSSQAEQQASSSSSPVAMNSTDKDLSVGSERGEDLVLVQKVFHYISLSIAALFFFEILIKLIVFRKKFLLNIWQVLDMLVVFAVVTVEVAFEIKGRIPELEACTFVVIFRLWRLPHMCNIKAKAVHRDMEQDLEVWKASKNKVEEKWRSLQAKYDKQKEKVERLEHEVMVLKREKNASQSQSSNSSSCTTTAIYDYVPKPDLTQEGFPFSEKVSDSHATAEHPTNDPLPCYITTNSEVLGEERMTRKTDRKDKEERENTKNEQDKHLQCGSSRQRVQSESESSHTCEESDRQVHVQIESGSEITDRTGLPGVDGDPGTSAVPEFRRDGMKKGSVCCYINGGFSLDGDNKLQEGDLHDEDGSRTYTSAEGIPMTDL